MSFLYERIATEIEQAIVGGVYPVGARLPSIRQVRDSHGVSMATALQAFARLEEKGLVEPKAKSGHFVKPPPSLTDQPGMSSPAPEPRRVSISHLTVEVVWSRAKSDLVSLASAIPSPAAATALARSTARVARLRARQTINYERPEGAQPLRAAIARLMVDSSCMVREDDIIVTNGAQEALALALRATTRANDVIAVESPTYFGVLQAIEVLGLRALELPTDPRGGVDLDALESAARSGRLSACILSPTYQNPLGFCMNDRDRQRAVSILAACEVPLIEDDVYGPLGFELPSPRPAKSFDQTGNVIHCGSFSKTVSPALRVGWAIPGRFTDEVLRQKFLTNLCSATVPQLAVADFLTGNRYRRITQAAARLYAQRLRILRESVLRHFPPGTKCTDPAGGFVLWVQMPAGCSAMELLERAREIGISFLPGNIFTPSEAYQNCFRLSVGTIENDQIPDVVARLAALAKRPCTAA